AVYLEREYLWRRRNFVDHVGAIGGIVDIGLEVVGQSVFGIVLFHQVSPEPEFEHEIDTDLDQRFADDWAILVRAFDHGHSQVWEPLPQVRGRKVPRGAASHNYHVARHGFLGLDAAHLLLSSTMGNYARLAPRNPNIAEGKYG